MPASTILLLSTDAAAGDSTAAILSAAGYTVTQTADPDEAFAKAVEQLTITTHTFTASSIATVANHTIERHSLFMTHRRIALGASRRFGQILHLPTLHHNPGNTRCLAGTSPNIPSSRFIGKVMVVSVGNSWPLRCSPRSFRAGGRRRVLRQS